MNMTRLIRFRTGLAAVRICPSASRLYSVEPGNIDTTTPGRKDHVGPAASTAEETDISALFNFGETLSGINHQDKTINTAVGSLPISPLLDPAWRKARKPRKKKQPPPFDKMPRFQRKLKQNPYAQLLAQPVRQCHVTRTRLPKPFLQSFGLVKHPETSNLWWMPAGFEETSKGSAAQLPDEADAQTAVEDENAPSSEPVHSEPVSLNESALTTPIEHTEPTAGEYNGAQSSSEESVSPSSEPAVAEVISTDDFATAVVASELAVSTAESRGNLPAPRDANFWAPAHVLARQDLLMEFLDKRSKHSGGQFRFGIIQSIGKLVGHATWRQDMHEVLRECTRRNIVDELISVSQTCEIGDRNYLVKIETFQDSLKYQNNHCFLLLTGEYEPFKYLEIPGVPGSARPVYHLPELLGPEQIQRLKSASPLFGDESLMRENALVLLKGKGNIELTKKLWRLEGFLANYVELG